jgi:16S rRNA (guanine(1405)-N(7))-methyltransferase
MIINSKEIQDEIIENLITEIRSKKKIATLDKNFIILEIKKYLSNHLNYIPKLSNKKSTEYKSIIKHVRSKSHDIYEIFQTNKTKERKKIIDDIKKLEKTDVLPLLDTHISTKERIPLYEELFKKIFSITGIPQSILDIGCGLNPVSIPFMEIDIKKIKYYACEMSQDDIDIIKKFFDKFQINGETFSCNLVTSYDCLLNYKCDICFAFKLFDVLESQKKNISYKIIESIKCKYLVASFATINIKNEKMRREKISYFERFIKKLGYSFKSLCLENELFYIISLENEKSKIL